MWRITKYMTECAGSAVMVDGEMPKYGEILHRVAQGCTLSPTLFKIYTTSKYLLTINDLVVVAVETAKQGVAMEEDTVSGLMFADDFVRGDIYQKHRRTTETNRETARLHSGNRQIGKMGTRPKMRTKPYLQNHVVHQITKKNAGWRAL